MAMKNPQSWATNLPSRVTLSEGFVRSDYMTGVLGLVLPHWLGDRCLHPRKFPV